MLWIIFGVVALLGAIAVSLVFGFIFMVAFEILSIAVEETFNLLFDTASLIVWCTRYIFSPREVPDDEIISL